MSFHHPASRGFPKRGGRGSWRGATRPIVRAGPPPANLGLPPPKPLGSIIDTIDIQTLLTEEGNPKITKVEYVASYNWTNGKSPVILVPGSPPAWTPPAADFVLKPDSEDVFRDVNAARYASYPMEPTFRSLQAMQPHHDLRNVDVVGCGSTVGNLLRFASSLFRPFRFDIDVIGETVFFIRKESNPKELIKGLQGFGHTFPEAYTTWDSEVRNSCSHQRIIQYDFGGLKFLVRTETDGYVKEGNAKTASSPEMSTNQSSLDVEVENLAIGSTDSSEFQQLQWKMQGRKVPQNRIFDIKTRASHKTFDMNEILPRLWLNQTSRFLMAHHHYGRFDKPTIRDVRMEVAKWERENSSLLERFHALVKRIVDVVRDSEQQQCEVSWDGQGSLLIAKQIGNVRRALPSDIIATIESSE